MAAKLYNFGEQSLINSWLYIGSTGKVGATQAFGVGLNVTAGGVASQDKTTNVGSGTSAMVELGATTAAGYTRRTINGNNGGGTNWPAANLVTTSMQTVGPQVTFTFTGTPVANGATTWFVALATTRDVADALFGADLAATRTFANGDTEKITPTFRAT